MAESKQPRKPIRPSQTASDLILAISRDRALRIAEHGSAALQKDSEERWKVTPDLWITVDKRIKSIWDELILRIKVDGPSALELFNEADWRAEPAAEPSRLLEKEGWERLRDSELLNRPIMSQVLKDAMRSARELAREADLDTWHVGPFLASALAHPDSLATAGFKQLGATDGALFSVAEWLRELPDPPSDGPAIDKIMADMQDLRYKLIGTIRKEQDAKSVGKRTLRTLYEEEPERYRHQPDLVEELKREPPKPENGWAVFSSTVRRAARWEALDRNAPEVTLAHLLLALTVDRTDTSAFLDDRSIDRASQRAEWDALSPRYAAGPAYPEDSPPFALTHPENSHYPQRYSDLAYLCAVFQHSRDPAVAALAKSGANYVDARIAEQVTILGDPEWHLKRPDLKELLKRETPKEFWTSSLRAGYCMEAAMFEARTRGDSEIRPAHMLVALLQVGTDMSALIDSTGTGRDSLVNRLIETLPVSDRGPIFPKPATSLSLCVSVRTKAPFSDLLIVEELLSQRPWLNEDRSWATILSEFGVTLQTIRAALPPMRDLVEEFKARKNNKGSTAPDHAG